MRRVIPKDTATLIAVLSAALDAFKVTLLELSRLHGNKPGPWLDQLEAKVLRSIKNTVSEGTTLDEEAAMMPHAIRVVADRFAEFRALLESKGR